MLGDLLALAISNLLRARHRSLMTAGGVLVATTTVIILVSLTLGLQENAESGLGSNQALTEIRVYPDRQRANLDEDVPELDQAAVEQFQALPGVQAVIPLAAYPGSGELFAGDYVNYAQIMGIDAENLPYLGVQAREGALTLEPGSALMGGTLPGIFFDPDDPNFASVELDVFTTPLQLQLTASNEDMDQRLIDLNVTGVIETETGNYMDVVFLPMTDLLQLYEWGSGEPIDPETFTYAQLIVRSSSRKTTGSVSAAIQELGYRTNDVGSLLDDINRFFGTMRLILATVGGVALLVSAFGVANTMMMAILERTSEIGLMKAVGARDRDVLFIFLAEAGLVGLGGGAAGAGLALVLKKLINDALQNATPGSSAAEYLPFDPAQLGGNLIVIPPDLLGLAIIVATGVGLLAGLFPALRAARMSPVEALRNQ